MKELSALLSTKYGIISGSICPVKGGWATKAAYRVTGTDGVEYFVKVYDRTLPTTRFIVERIEKYMPVLYKLAVSQFLQGRVLTPIPMFNGSYKAESDSDVYAVFLFVDGKTPGISGMTEKQTIELAEILACLHDTSKTISFNMTELAEDTSLSFCERLINYLDKPEAINNIPAHQILQNADMLKSASIKALNLRDKLRLGYSPLVLCHGDAHGNNVIQSDKLVLADWDNLSYAPVEADLFIHTFHKKYSDIFLEAYCAARRGYLINKDLLYFYTLRNHLGDIWVDIERLIQESPCESEIADLLEWISQSITEVRELS
jgi:Ser/Thr protein kinase RdoA (MazF antagonist)